MFRAMALTTINLHGPTIAAILRSVKMSKKPKHENRESKKDRAKDKDDRATPRDDDRDSTVPDDQKRTE